MRELLRAGCVAVLAAVAVVAAPAPASAAPPDVLKTAVAKTAAVPTMRVAIRVAIRQQGEDEVAFTGEGVADTRAKRGRTTLDFSSLVGSLADFPPSKLRATVIYDASRGYVLYLRFPALQQLARIRQPWLKVDLVALGKEQGVDLSDLQPLIQGDPAQQLQYLRATIGTPKVIGRERVRGLRTTHYRTQLDYARAPAYAPPALRSIMRRAARELIRDSGSRTAPIDVWIDDEGFVRRVAIVQKTLRPEVTETSLSAEFHGFGLPVRVTLPRPSDVYDLGN